LVDRPWAPSRRFKSFHRRAIVASSRRNAPDRRRLDDDPALDAMRSPTIALEMTLWNARALAIR